MRSTRNQPFCWQEKKILRLIRKTYQKNNVKMSKMKLLYCTLTEIDNDFNGKQINYYTDTIRSYSGLSKAFISRSLKEFEELGIIKLDIERVNGKITGKTLTFTPENIKEQNWSNSENTNIRNSIIKKPINGKHAALEESINKKNTGNNIHCDSSGLKAGVPCTSNNKKNTGIDELKKSKYSEDFLSWFNDYPKQKDKTKARAYKWWCKKTKKELKEILTATEEYKKFVNSENTRNQFIIAAANFIGRDERYIDFIPEESEPEKTVKIEFYQPPGIELTEEQMAKLLE